MSDLLVGALISVPGLVLAWWVMRLPTVPREPWMPKPMSARRARRADRQLQEIYDYLPKRDAAFERELNAELFALIPQEVQQFGTHFVGWLGAAHRVLDGESCPGDDVLDTVDVPVAHDAWFDVLLAEAGLALREGL
jgi:hypothetical protein